MTPRLISPADAVGSLHRKLNQKWAKAVCAEHGVGSRVTFAVPLRPGVSTGSAVARLGYPAWDEWRRSWRTLADRHLAGVSIVHKPVSVQGVRGEFPATLVADLDGAVALVSETGRPPVDLDRARALASLLASADAVLTPANLRAVYRLKPHDVEVLLSAVTWLHANPDASAWTARQLPIPGMHTKWLESHGALLRDVTGRDVRQEVRPRPAVLHLTYVDPGHLASGRRRHDAWTTGDAHDVAYQPRIVLVVENRDSRLWFPPVPDTIVVEGGGKAAAVLLAGVPWIRAADHIVYWGDMDEDGYAILDAFRAALAEPGPGGSSPKEVTSLLMDDTDLNRYAEYGVNHDRHGRPLEPGSGNLERLTEGEAAAYNTLTTEGASFRRIEQETIPLTDAAARLLEILSIPTSRGE